MKTRRATTPPSTPPGDDTRPAERPVAPRWMKPVEIKLHPPTPPAAQVERTAVRDRICSARSAKLILVRAPAGYGKTTLMAQVKAHLRATGVGTAWVTIDRADNDVSRLLQCLEQAVVALDGEDSPGADAVDSLCAMRAPFVLFLDEFEVLHEPAAIGLVQEILERLPRQGQLVIGTRNLPDLGLARLRALVELEWAGNSRQLPRVVASAKLERSRLFLMQGQAAAAKDELERARGPAVWDKVRSRRFPAHDLEDLLVGRLRWEIRFGDARASAESRHRRVLKLQVLHALALERAGEPDAALGALGMALREGSREGFLRLLADEGEGVGRLVLRHMQGPGARMVAQEPLFAEYLQRLLAAIGPLESAEPDPAPELAIELTRKELRVLGLLATGYSNQAIVEKLFVSDSTVRTHLRNIYTKLKASNRTHAVAVARKLALVP